MNSDLLAERTEQVAPVSDRRPSRRMFLRGSIVPEYRSETGATSNRLRRSAQVVVASRSGCPEGTGLHFPSFPLTSHAWQVSVQAPSQQVPSTQCPPAHSALVPHGCPIGVPAPRAAAERVIDAGLQRRALAEVDAVFEHDRAASCQDT